MSALDPLRDSKHSQTTEDERSKLLLPEVRPPPGGPQEPWLQLFKPVLLSGSLEAT